MSPQALPPAPGEPLRVVVAGAGAMGVGWIRAVAAEPTVELVGVADLDFAVARAAVDGTAPRRGQPVPISADAVTLALAVGAHALIDVTVPVAHHPVTTAALFAGLPVLGEKPVAATLPEALSLAAASEVTGMLFMVSQSRRWNPRLFALREQLAALGSIAFLTTEFFRASHLPGFREQMDDPLLLDMAIHPFDSARFLLRTEPVSVYCEAHNPAWSWFAGSAAATATFVMDGGARYVYTGCWCAPGAQTSWNGAWRASGARGSALWDGDRPPTLHLDRDDRDDRDAASGELELTAPDAHPTGIEWALRTFAAAVRTGERPMGEVHENLMSLAMVDAAVRSSRTGTRVLLDDILATAHAAALGAEERDDVRDALAAWPSVRDALAAWPSAVPALPEPT